MCACVRLSARNWCCDRSHAPHVQGAAGAAGLPPTRTHCPSPAHSAPPPLQILSQLEQCKSIPDFNNYLAFIFAHGEGLPVEVRRPPAPSQV